MHNGKASFANGLGAVLLWVPLAAVNAAEAAPVLTTVRVADGLTEPTHVTGFPDDTTRLVVCEQAGRIRLVENGVVAETDLLDLRDRVTSGGEQGLFCLAFHPEFASNGYLYVHYSDTNGDSLIERYTINDTGATADPATASPVLLVTHPKTSPWIGHYAGQIAFGPNDGYLYIGLGDAGPRLNAQDHATLLGKILRIDVDGGVPYAIPADNPFATAADPDDTARDEIWALGLRNPWRFSFDRETGDLYIGDVGADGREEVNFAPASDVGGLNYGWPVLEGAQCRDPATTCDETGLTPPIHDYEHRADECASVTGGFVYRGAIPALGGTYFFADFCNGGLVTFRQVDGAVADLQDRAGELDPPVGRRLISVSSFGEDAAGELYMVRRVRGDVLMIVEDDTPVPSSCGPLGLTAGLIAPVGWLGVVAQRRRRGW